MREFSQFWVGLIQRTVATFTEPIKPLDAEGNPNMNCLTGRGDFYSERYPRPFPKLRRYKKPPIMLSGPLAVRGPELSGRRDILNTSLSTTERK